MICGYDAGSRKWAGRDVVVVVAVVSVGCLSLEGHDRRLAVLVGGGV